MKYFQKYLFTSCIFLCSVSVFANSTDWFFTQTSIGTSAVVYGDESVEEQNDLIKAEGDTFRFVLSSDAAVGVILSPQVRILTGALISTDFCTHGDYYANRIDYGGFTGVRIYTGLAGLVSGVDYVCGRRADYLNLPNGSGSTVSRTSWGNGFRFTAEYDFNNGQKAQGWAPVISMSYRRMPRGGSYDHNFTICFKAGF